MGHKKGETVEVDGAARRAQVQDHGDQGRVSARASAPALPTPRGADRVATRPRRLDSPAMTAPKRFPDRDEIAAVRAEAEPLENGATAETTRRLAGRVMARRDMGKLVFLDLVDRSGRIQLLCPVERTGEIDVHLGDVVGVTGLAREVAPRRAVAARSTRSSCSRASARRCPTRSTG